MLLFWIVSFNIIFSEFQYNMAVERYEWNKLQGKHVYSTPWSEETD